MTTYLDFLGAFARLRCLLLAPFTKFHAVFSGTPAAVRRRTARSCSPGTLLKKFGPSFFNNLSARGLTSCCSIVGSSSVAVTRIAATAT